MFINANVSENAVNVWRVAEMVVFD